MNSHEFKTTGHILYELNLNINNSIKVKYKNWKDEIGIRIIIPLNIWYGSTEYHTKPQWLMNVWDVDKDTQRTYALMDIIEFIKEG